MYARLEIIYLISTYDLGTVYDPMSGLYLIT